MNNVLATLCLGVGLWVSATLPGQAQLPKPDFSGTWTFNPARSDTADVAPRKSWILQIKHSDPTFEITSTVEGATGKPRIFEIGGKPVRDDSETQGEATSQYWWEGQSLVSEFRWGIGVQKDVRTLSADRQTLTDIRTIDQTIQGEPKRRVMRLVFERQ